MTNTLKQIQPKDSLSLKEASDLVKTLLDNRFQLIMQNLPYSYDKPVHLVKASVLNTEKSLGHSSFWVSTLSGAKLRLKDCISKIEILDIFNKPHRIFNVEGEGKYSTNLNYIDLDVLHVYEPISKASVGATLIVRVPEYTQIGLISQVYESLPATVQGTNYLDSLKEAYPDPNDIKLYIEVCQGEAIFLTPLDRADIESGHIALQYICKPCSHIG